MNKKLMMAAAAAMLCASTVSADIPMAYYASLDGKCGEELKTAIHNLISTNVSMLSYGSGQENTWWGFYVTDYQMDGTKRQVIDRYSNDVRYFGNRGSSVSGMNIEHSFPKSWWGGTSNNAYKDLYNLMPCEQKINSSKSNYGMGVVTNATNDNSCTKVGDGADGFKLWEPADKWKGDFARGYMYMATAYQNFTWEGQALNSLQQGAYPTLKQWAYELYIKWAKQDNVNQMEIDRNQAVADIQGNRNPYIDFPNLMEYVWGDSINRPLNLKTTLKAGKITGTGGDTPVSVVLYSQTFKEDNGGCTASGTPNIWKINSKYGYTASAYYSDTAHAADASITTPTISLKGLLAANLTFSHAANKLSNQAPSQVFKVSIIKDGGAAEDISSKVTWPKGTNWTFVDAGTIDLTGYVGHDIQIMFTYTSTDAIAGTWEITDLKVAGKHSAGIEDIVIPSDFDNEADLNAPVEYYSIDGRRLNPDTARGLVIKRQGRHVTKIVIR